ncbi:penicillin-binding transpeptidase domain-containing protein [Streptomyces sp. AN091965]|uniref:penicillin-binding transpeptidase domain-containing protein n=1 Tax=Streptomyces sp. AN091965 TaxID=2927803 RepID=UPI001F612262|nr:penicillin-binding transpeptidase domain-containing protein [Streptomyces sp. AN091965]MCI3928459.1 penicillin-binding protein [Streptomyces sp. AN091965]
MNDTEGTTYGRAAPARKARRTRAAVAAGVAVALAAGTAYATDLGPFAAKTPKAPKAAPEAAAQARAFLADWSAGRLARAARLTSSPGQAERVLRNFTTGLDIGKPALRAGEATADEGGTVTVPFTATMPVTGLGTWTYRSRLPLRERNDGTWAVDWKLSVVHPKLSDTEKFRLEREDTGAARVNDRRGSALSGDTHPSLAPVLAQLSGAAGAGPRGAIRRVDRTSGDVTGTEATFGARRARTPQKPVATTIDPAWQSAAERALAAGAKGKDAALVALRVDNGEILAVANSPATGFNRALSGTYAPGSTFKVVTTSALLLKGALAPGDTVDCPRYLTVGKQFHNVEKSEHRGATFREDFAESCNTAFIGLRGKLADDGLGEVARRYFGIGQRWRTGVPSFDGAVPAPRDETEKAAAMIGQGRVLANPLVMASVTATAASGTFRQPTLTPGQKDTTRTKALPREVVGALRSLMRTTVTDGTARGLAALPGAVGAKTGTAEVAEGTPNNGWMVAHRGNVALAAVVEKGRTGGASAGPVVKEVLAAVDSDPS